MDAAYIEILFEIEKIFGKRRVFVRATFFGYIYDGQIVRRGTPNYILGVRKDSRAKIGNKLAILFW